MTKQRLVLVNLPEEHDSIRDAILVAIEEGDYIELPLTDEQLQLIAENNKRHATNGPVAE